MLLGMLHVTPVIGALFLEGVTAEGEPMLIVTAENPDRINGFPDSITKEALERFHLDTFHADYILHFGVPFFDRVIRGEDPPDFRLETPTGSVALDCAVLADQHQRNSYRLMEHLRRKLIDESANRDFSGVAGCIISVWFGNSLADRPPKRSDDSVVDPLLDAIALCKVDHEAMRRLNSEIASRGFPQVMPPVIATGRTPDGAAGFVANVVTDPGEGVRFSTGLGFEVQLHRPVQVTLSDALARLRKVIQSHDRPEIDHMLITAGGPDVRGYRYPAEEAIARLALSHLGAGVEARYIKQATIHLWFSKFIADVPIITVE